MTYSVVLFSLSRALLAGDFIVEIVGDFVVRDVGAELEMNDLIVRHQQFVPVRSSYSYEVLHKVLCSLVSIHL